MHSTQFSLSALVKSKRPNVPVFLIYAGIIHAIGLALLLPIVVTLPGPGGEVGPETSVIDVQIIPATPLAGRIESDSEPTAALPSAPVAVEEGPAVTPDQAAVVPAPAEEEPEQAGEEAAPPPRDEAEEEAAPREEQAAAPPVKKSQEPRQTKSDTAAKPAPQAAKKPIAARSKAAKPPARRSAKMQTKITPFNGAFSGLFSPGTSARRR